MYKVYHIIAHSTSEAQDHLNSLDPDTIIISIQVLSANTWLIIIKESHGD